MAAVKLSSAMGTAVVVREVVAAVRSVDLLTSPPLEVPAMQRVGAARRTEMVERSRRSPVLEVDLLQLAVP